ncbi:MAG: hypothetical protein Q8R76_01200 [Candidatus Omnitrophota bacterium]|nr:hypothetical protein [Candidatus Omnitrophota bacterium]
MEHHNKYPTQVKADNTALNARDRDQRSVTPLDPGSSRADTDTTVAIRKDIMAREGMSADAQNVKIITQNGKKKCLALLKEPKRKGLSLKLRAGDLVRKMSLTSSK